MSIHRDISEPIMSENSPKIYLFVSSVKFSIQLCGNTARQCDTPQDFGAFSIQSLATLLSTFPPFLSVLFFHFNKSNFRCVFTKTVILLGLESHSNKLHFPDKTKKKGEMNTKGNTKGHQRKIGWMSAYGKLIRGLQLINYVLLGSQK